MTELLTSTTDATPPQRLDADWWRQATVYQIYPRSFADANGDGLADDIMVEIPAVGAGGGAPLPGFLEGVFGPTP